MATPRHFTRRRWQSGLRTKGIRSLLGHCTPGSCNMNELQVYRGIAESLGRFSESDELCV